EKEWAKSAQLVFTLGMPHPLRFSRVRVLTLLSVRPANPSRHSLSQNDRSTPNFDHSTQMN
ncbi:MAG: hypothetical protein WA829_04955, partial [Candidatus Acidiferrum sp.]